MAETSDTPSTTETEDSPEPIGQVLRWRDPQTAAAVATITQVLLAFAAGWFLLDQLSPIIRPLLIAVFLAYVLMPTYSRLRRSIGSPAAIGVLVGFTAIILIALGLVTAASIFGLSEDMPRLQQRGEELSNQVGHLVEDVAPWASETTGSERSSQPREDLTARMTRSLLTLAAEVVVESCVVAMYLLFLLLGASRFPDRVRAAYPPARADQILGIAGQVSAAIVGYLRIKVKASLVLAIPIGLILWACGVKFAVLWALLTFLCNFIPYVGPIVAYTLPVGFSFLWFGVTWQPITAAALLLACHTISAAMVEPMMIGNAVGLSPLVLLASLAFWGLLWGIPGMFLAVPLTVVAVIVMNHFDNTRPIAQILGSD